MNSHLSRAPGVWLVCVRSMLSQRLAFITLIMPTQCGHVLRTSQKLPNCPESPSEVGHDQLCALAKPLHFSEALFPTVPTAWESGEGPPLIGAAYTKRLVNRARACGTAYPGPRPATGPQTHNGGNLPSPSQQARTWRAGLRPQPHSDQPHVHGRWWEAPALTVVMCGLRTTEDGE